MMPRQRDVVREQIRIVGLSLRIEALIVAVFLGGTIIMSAIDLARGNAATWFDGSEWLGFTQLSFLLPFAVWRRDSRFGPAFLWTLPVDRRRLALAKVFAGWVWLMTAQAAFMLWLFVLSLAAHVTVLPRIWQWIIPFTATTAMYLLGSALVVGVRHPVRWLLGAVGVCFLLANVYDVHGPAGLLSALDSAATVWRKEPDLALWAIVTSLWLAAGLAALWAAVSRHRETR